LGVHKHVVYRTEDQDSIPILNSEFELNKELFTVKDFDGHQYDLLLDEGLTDISTTYRWMKV
jgi:hypothetical protein